MQRDPSLPRRRSIRLPLFDYSQPYSYFVTICSANKECIFGRVSGTDVVLSPLGRIVNDCWLEIPRHFPTVELVRHVVMPNHIHGILRIQLTEADGRRLAKQQDRARHAVPLRPVQPARDFASPTVGSIPTILGAFKGAASRRAASSLSFDRKQLWQRGYYERVIRTDKELGETSEYIRLNPSQWRLDSENPGVRAAKNA